ncbi:PD-(D/E)XK nuclease family protein [Niallia taxi]|uniref:PD-(D/E)XK nuclease family protein n=1 Tax=Niallia taxi TaxID=2499688 RepID=UPI00300B638A
MDAKEKLDQLYESGAKVFSFSKLGTFDNCEYEYLNTYIKKNRGIDNVYTLLGSELHDNIEKIYGNESDIDKFKESYFNKLVELDILGVNFPNEKIGDSWKADVGHFLNNFNKIDKKMILEKLIVFEVTDGIWMQGYIDSISPSEQGKPYVNIIDWKTSSKFAGKKLSEAGRQLLMYKLGLESTTNFKVDNVMWFMIKYLYVCHKLKNGNTKKKMCNRGKWVKEMRATLEKELYKSGLEEFEVELLLDEAIKENNLNNLPDEIKSRYWLEDCFVEYEATEEKIEELKKYVTDTVAAIESKNKENEEEWKPREISKFDSFYCSTLCGHRKTCTFYKKFLNENSDEFNKSKKKDDFDDLFS